MAAENVYKLLFFVQSAAFTVFIINFAQSPLTEHKPMQRARGQCEEWKPNETRAIVATERPGPRPTVSRPDEDAALEFRGPLSNCSLSDVKKRPGVVMLTTANLAFVDFVLNLLESVKRVGVCINTTVIAEDKKAYQLLHKKAQGDPAVHVQLTNSGEMDHIEHSRHQRSQYYGILNKRQAYMLVLLEQGLEILFTDSDTYWFRDPFPHFQGEFDMCLRSFNPTRIIPKTTFCAGFNYLKPTNATIQFVRGWAAKMDMYKKQNSYPVDQNVMNALLKADKPVHVDIKFLEPNLFPWGPTFFDPKWQKEHHPTVVMHAASVRGHAAKVSKFKAFGMWHVNDTELKLESKNT